jgi:hypothetical protein
MRSVSFKVWPFSVYRVFLASGNFDASCAASASKSAREFARILSSRKAAGRPMSQFDAMIAAIARVHRATLATRNIADFQHCGIRLINPWAASDVH